MNTNQKHQKISQYAFLEETRKFSILILLIVFQSTLIRESHEIYRLVLILTLMPLMTQLPTFVVIYTNLIRERPVNEWISRGVTIFYTCSATASPFIILLKVRRYRLRLQSIIFPNRVQSLISVQQ